MNWRLLLSTMAVTAVAELPDKTALAALFLATRQPAGTVFIGAAAAFLIQSAIAVAIGHALGAFPARFVHLGAGALFLALAAAVLARREEDEEEKANALAGGQKFRGSVLKAFAVIFIAEWGDLTQFSTAALAARYRSPWTVMVGATLGLWAVAAAAVILGRRARSSLNPAWLQKAAAAVFALVGLFLLAEGLLAI